jgi:multiple sugar transport system permease protein
VRKWIPEGTVAILALFAAWPFFWAVLSSFAPEHQLFAGGSLLPRPLVLENYRALVQERSFWIPLRNSLGVAAVVTFVALALGSLAGYALARLPVPRRDLILGGILSIVMIPQISLVPPLYLFLRAMGLVDTFAGLVLSHLALVLPLTIWILMAFFRQIPPELEEAAMTDGAGILQVLRHVVLPLSWPALSAAGILAFLFSWNEFLFALSFTVTDAHRTVPVAIALFRGQYQVPWGQILAASVTASLPVILVVILFQGRIVRGLTTGALKG